MSKGSAAVLCVILTVQALLAKERRTASWRTLPFWGLAILAVGFQLWMAAGEQGALARGLWRQAVSSASALARYVGAMAFPFGLNVLHDVPSPKGTLGLETLAAISLVGLWIAATVVLAKRNPAWCMALVWPLMALLPAANTAMLRDRPFAEQRAYLATGGFCLLLAAVAATRRDARPWMRRFGVPPLGGVLRRDTCAGMRGFGVPPSGGVLRRDVRSGMRLCVALTLLLLGAGTLERIHDWRDNRSLWTDASRKTPGEPKAHFNLGVAHGNLGEFGKAEREFRRAVKLRPAYATAWHSLGMLCRMAGRLDEAEAHLKEALRLNPSSAEAHNSLGIVLSELGRPERAVAEFQAALKLKPTYLEVWH
ncbi:MAG: tetratricopeptide repeat protein, partial [Verrucomicrobia bacterium]|nr:tetratricopeptide repeat protein [Verrucomicrobiota bacterium]